MRISKGNGIGFRLVKGVYYHTGGSQARYMPEVRETDYGTLYLTNRRIIFNGRFESRSYDLKDILEINNYKDAFKLTGVGRKNPYFIVNNPYLWSLLIKIVIGSKNLDKLPHISLDIR